MVGLLTEEDPIDCMYLVNNYDWLYIWWWNTFRLLKLIKETWFDKVINHFIQLEKPIYGWSAWAIIMGKEIHTSPDLNIEKLNFIDTLGFDFFNWYSIFCHYDDKYDPEIRDYIKNYGNSVLCLKEWVWAYIKDNSFYIAGSDDAYILDLNWKYKIKCGDNIW
jgi:dipeptidase E